MLPKIIIVLVLFTIVFALLRGLFFLVKGQGNPKKTVNSLTWRIGLSVILIGAIVVAIQLGYIEPHGINPNVK